MIFGEKERRKYGLREWKGDVGIVGCHQGLGEDPQHVLLCCLQGAVPNQPNQLSPNTSLPSSNISLPSSKPLSSPPSFLRHSSVIPPSFLRHSSVIRYLHPPNLPPFHCSSFLHSTEPLRSLTDSSVSRDFPKLQFPPVQNPSPPRPSNLSQTLLDSKRKFPVFLCADVPLPSAVPRSCLPPCSRSSAPYCIPPY